MIMRYINSHLHLQQHRNLHGYGTNSNAAESARLLPERVQMLREYRGGETKTCGVPAGREFIIAENLRGVFDKKCVLRYRLKAVFE